MGSTASGRTAITEGRPGGAPSRDTAQHLLDAAERSIATQGVEAVSLRSITAAAGANVAAIHYHFGSKHDLVRAALHRRMDALASERLAMVAAIERDDEPVLRDVVAAFAVPFLRFARQDAGAAWAGMLAALVHAGRPWTAMVADAFEPQWRRVEPVLRRALPPLRDDELAFRVAAAGAVLLGPAVDHAGINNVGAGAMAPIDMVIDVITGIFMPRAAALMREESA